MTFDEISITDADNQTGTDTDINLDFYINLINETLNSESKGEVQ